MGGMIRPGAARADYSEVVLVRRLRDALALMTGAVHSQARPMPSITLRLPHPLPQRLRRAAELRCHRLQHRPR